ncbi:MAG: YihY/virulence factor BrkB family protein [Deltaproteobacteria bacterium]|nr:YihY/virulence factor BrkB family protein [Deltaproteobacteria bacterium]
MAEKRPTIQDLRRRATWTIGFLSTDIWRIRRKDLPRLKAFFIRFLRIVLLTFRGVAEDRVQLRASSLTFYSLLSVVPVLAMIFGIAKGFGFEKNLREILLERLSGQEAVALRIIEFSHALLDNVKGGLVAGIGVVVLFYTIIKILSHIESAFNDIWGVKKSRPLGRKITDYLSMMLICPVLFLMSSAATVVIASGVQFVVDRISLLGPVAPLITILLNFLPYCVMWVLFTFVYMFMPNNQVRFTSGLLAGIIAGTAYHLFQWVYIFFQFNMTRYNAIYGSFAALPLFFIWLQVSWGIVLFGAEISFAHQNVDTYEFEKDCLTASRAFKRLISLRIVHLLVHNFSKGLPPWSALRISQHLEIPIRLVNQLLYELLDAGVLTESRAEGNQETGYQPGRDPDALTIKAVLDALDHLGNEAIPIARTEELERLSRCLQGFGEVVEASPHNRLLKSI